MKSSGFMLACNGYGYLSMILWNNKFLFTLFGGVLDQNRMKGIN